MFTALVLALLAAAAPSVHASMKVYDPDTKELIGDMPMEGMPGSFGAESDSETGPYAITRKLMCQACMAAMTESWIVVSEAYKNTQGMNTAAEVGVKRNFGKLQNLGSREAQVLHEMEEHFCMVNLFRRYTYEVPEMAKNCVAFWDEYNDDFQVENALRTASTAQLARTRACKAVCAPIPKEERMPELPKGPPPMRAPPTFRPPWLDEEGKPKPPPKKPSPATEEL